MSLKVSYFKKLIEDFAPTELKESYDNVGLMVGDIDSDVTSVLISLDCTLNVIDEALRKNCNLIITHHPLLFLKPKSVTMQTLQGRKIIKLIKNSINVYSCHTNLDSTKGGMNDILMNILGFKSSLILEHSACERFKDSDTGIGRIAELNKPVKLKKLLEDVKCKLNLPYVIYTGDENLTIKKVAVINGSGGGYIDAAKMAGADCIITGDTQYHRISDSNEEDVAVIDAGHFGTEWPAMKIVGSMIEENLRKDGFKNNVYISQVNESPYKIMR